MLNAHRLLYLKTGCILGCELQKILEYKDWCNFPNAIQKANKSCKSNRQTFFDHFVDINKMIELGNGATRDVANINNSSAAKNMLTKESKRKNLKERKSKYG